MRNGIVYCVSNPAWPEWLKIGRTENEPKHRQTCYNGGSPHRDYVFTVLFHTTNSKEAEKLVHQLFRTSCTQGVTHSSKSKSEWFKITLDEARALILANLSKLQGEVTVEQPVVKFGLSYITD